MSIITRYHPRCDKCGRVTAHFYDVSERGIFRALRETSWTRDKGEDVCPACNKSIPDYWVGGF